MNINDLMIPQEKTLENQILVVQPDTRTIDVPNDFLLGVETDNDAERVKFQCPKIVGDNLDLSQYHIYIHYQNAKGEKGKYLCEDIEDGGENITFSWLLSQKVTLYKGQTKFLVCAKKTQEDTIVWNTTLANGNVLEGLDVDEDIVQQNDDVIEQILLKLEQIEASGGTGDINNAQVTFTEAQERTNIESQETMSTLFGKIKKWFADLKQVAFSGSYTDLSNTPTIPSKTSDLTNDSNFVTKLQLSTKLDKNLGADNNGKYLSVGDDGGIVPTDLPDISEPYTLPQATATTLGGIKAKAKTTETVEVSIDEETSKLYVPTYPESGSNFIKVGSVEANSDGDILTVSGLNLKFDKCDRMMLIIKAATVEDNRGFKIAFNEKLHDMRIQRGSSLSSNFGYVVFDILFFKIGNVNIIYFNPFQIFSSNTSSSINSNDFNSNGIIISEDDSIDSVSFTSTNSQIKEGSILEVYKQ